MLHILRDRYTLRVITLRRGFAGCRVPCFLGSGRRAK